MQTEINVNIEEKPEHYVYVYLDPRKTDYCWKFEYGGVEQWFDLEPFYVGVGKNWRSTDHLNGGGSNNILKNSLIRKLLKDGYDREYFKKFLIIKLCANISREEALLLEVKLIKRFGRRDNKTGILTNLTDGGEGSPGVFHTEKRRKEFSKNHKGKKPVIEISNDNEFIREFESTRAVENFYRGKRQNGLVKHLKGRDRSWFGRYFVYKYIYENKELFNKHLEIINRPDKRITPIVLLDNNFNYINSFDSVLLCAKFLDGNVNTIGQALIGKYVFNLKYRVLYENIYNDTKLFNDFKNDVPPERKSIKINQYDLSGNLVGKYDSINYIAKKLKIDHGGIKNSADCRTPSYKGFIWKYE